MTQTANNYGRILYHIGVTKEVAKETQKIFFLTPELQKALESPVVPKKEKNCVIERIFPKEVQNFLKVLCEHERLNLLEEVFKAYETEYEKKHHILHGYLRCAAPLTKEQRIELEEYLKKKYKAEKIALEEKEEKDLMGGFVLRVNDIEEDWSLKGRLNRLEQRLVWRR